MMNGLAPINYRFLVTEMSAAVWTHSAIRLGVYSVGCISQWLLLSVQLSSAHGAIQSLGMTLVVVSSVVSWPRVSTLNQKTL